MAIQGIFASNDGMVGDRQGDFANAVLQVNPTGTALFLALTSGMVKENAADVVFNWFEDTHISGRSQAVSGGTTTTVVVNDGSFYVPGAVLLVEETGERILVTASAGNSLTVVRGLGGTTITAITNVMNIQQIGNAHEEASGIPVAVTQQGKARLNFVQIFRNAWAITGTAKAVSFRTGSKLAKNKRDAAMYHAEDMERAFLWGVKHLGVLNGNQFRTTDGVVKQIEDYGGKVLSAASGGTPGDLNFNDLSDWLQDIFSLNVKGQPNERIMLGGNSVLKAFNRIVFNEVTYNIEAGETKFGIMVNTIMTPFGTVKLMTHPLMNESPYFSRQAYVLHPGGIRRRVLRDTFQEDYDKNGNRIDGKDADQGVITTEAGVQVGAAQTMGILRNVIQGVANA